MIMFTVKGRRKPDKKVCKLLTAPYLFQGGVRYSIARYSQVSESVIQLVEELYKGAVFS